MPSSAILYDEHDACEPVMISDIVPGEKVGSVRPPSFPTTSQLIVEEPTLSYSETNSTTPFGSETPPERGRAPKLTISQMPRLSVTKDLMSPHIDLNSPAQNIIGTPFADSSTQPRFEYPFPGSASDTSLTTASSSPSNTGSPMFPSPASILSLSSATSSCSVLSLPPPLPVGYHHTKSGSDPNPHLPDPDTQLRSPGSGISPPRPTHIHNASPNRATPTHPNFRLPAREPPVPPALLKRRRMQRWSIDAPAGLGLTFEGENAPDGSSFTRRRASVSSPPEEL